MIDTILYFINYAWSVILAYLLLCRTLADRLWDKIPPLRIFVLQDNQTHPFLLVSNKKCFLDHPLDSTPRNRPQHELVFHLHRTLCHTQPCTNNLDDRKMFLSLAMKNTISHYVWTIFISILDPRSQRAGSYKIGAVIVNV